MHFLFNGDRLHLGCGSRGTLLLLRLTNWDHCDCSYRGISLTRYLLSCLPRALIHCSAIVVFTRTDPLITRTGANTVFYFRASLFAHGTETPLVLLVLTHVGAMPITATNTPPDRSRCMPPVSVHMGYSSYLDIQSPHYG